MYETITKDLFRHTECDHVIASEDMNKHLESCPATRVERENKAAKDAEGV